MAAQRARVTRTEEPTVSKAAEKIKWEEDREMTNPGFAGLWIRTVSLQEGVWRRQEVNGRRKSRDRALAISLQRKENVRRASEEEGIRERDFCVKGCVFACQSE